jgi:hypothetical protein
MIDRETLEVWTGYVVYLFVDAGTASGGCGAELHSRRLTDEASTPCARAAFGSPLHLPHFNITNIV